MGRSRPPKFDRLPPKPKDAKARLLEQSRNRIEGNIDALHRGDLNHAYVAFEALAEALAALSSQTFTQQDLQAAWPVASWRENTVTIPTELLAVILEPWARWARPESAWSLEEHYGFQQPNRQGSKPMKSVQAALDRKRRLSRKVLVRHATVEGEEGMPLTAAISDLAAEEDVSIDTVKRAYKEISPSTLRKIKAKTRET